MSSFMLFLVEAAQAGGGYESEDDGGIWCLVIGAVVLLVGLALAGGGKS